jgi:uncharacterized protein YfdQ (DUF2303 family)
MAETRTESDVVSELTAAAVKPHELNPENPYGLVLPDGHVHHVIDLEHLLEEPRRTRGTALHHTASSLGAYVVRHRDAAATTLYADQEHAAIVAILNDAGELQSGWGDHRATLQLQLTKAWRLWAGMDGRLMGQADFAEHIEAGIAEILDPPAADMLELAQTFEAQKGVQFRSALRLADGQRALRYEETIEGRAGVTGDIAIPKQFGLAIEPYDGSEARELSARLRYRIDGGNLKIGYILVRPHEVLRDAFEAALASVERDSELKAFRGIPPARS